MNPTMSNAVRDVDRLVKQGKPLNEAIQHAVHRYGVGAAELRAAYRDAHNAWKDTTFAYRYGSKP